MPLKHSTELCLDVEVGERGLSRDALDAAVARTRPALDWLRAAHRDNALPMLGLPGRTDDLSAIGRVAEALSRSADVLVLGTGGSSLGAQTLAQAAGWRVPVAGDFRSPPRLHFLDNLDPDTFSRALRALPLETTSVLVVSKSGGTGETLMQTMVLLAAFEEAGLRDAIAQRFVGLSEPTVPGVLNKLRKLLEGYGVPFADHDPGVGGRFSVLSNVGLVPAALAGCDIAAVRSGAARALAPVIGGAEPRDCPCAVGAAVAVAFAEQRGIATNVVMAYADRLERFTRWWVQLWSESLGKQGRGMTAVPALGPVDQHSALQLFLDGPADKLFTVVATGCRDRGPRIDPALAAEGGQPEFGGRTVGDLVASQQRATAETLARNGRPVRTIMMDAVDESHVGELLMHFMLETIVAARLLDVDAFDQPAVEEGKVLARAYLEQL